MACVSRARSWSGGAGRNSSYWRRVSAPSRSMITLAVTLFLGSCPSCRSCVSPVAGYRRTAERKTPRPRWSVTAIVPKSVLPLSTDGAPAGHDPAAGDIVYRAAGGDVVLYYDDDAP